MKILFVEDDQHTCEFIAEILHANRYAVDMVTDAETGLEMASQWPYDLILLDVMLPKLNGIEMCRQLRLRGTETPVLILTAKGASEDVIAGLDAGADDYVVKSCEPEQLMARVRALLRRGQEVSSNPLLTWGDLCLDPSAAQVTFQQAVVPCRPKEYTLLELLLRNPQRLLSRSNIIDHLWPFDGAPVEGSVTNLIKDLRRRLQAAGMEQDLIETVYGLGYRLKPRPSGSASTLETESDIQSRPSPDRTSREKLQVVLHEVGEKFRASWAERLTALDEVEQAIQDGEFNVKQLEAALSQVHKLAGGLGTFGYDQASAIAEALEQSISTQLSQQAQWTREFSESLEKLHQELLNPGQREYPHSTPASPSQNRK